ncbi:MAG: hypothetical protein K0Q79_3507 [Flavipsychrobacter sp.]|jgi:hypothetical protein|nr:hypothetical protein [Flavipsychrobacter sp.]
MFSQKNFNNIVINSLGQIMAQQDVIVSMLKMQLANGDGTAYQKIDRDINAQIEATVNAYTRLLQNQYSGQ